MAWVGGDPGLYDPQTRSMLRTDQVLPEVGNQMPRTVINPDTTADVCLGPEPRAGKEADRMQTVPGKGWFVTLRPYAPLEQWFDKTCGPGQDARRAEAGSLVVRPSCCRA
jgi:hypothetical protein